MKKLFIEPRQKIYNISIFDPIKNLFGKKIDENKICNFFKNKFNFQNVLTVSQGRIGIYLAVKSIINSNKNEILLSPYTVFDVVNMVICAGGKPIFVDINFPSISVSLEDLNSKMNNSTAGIIVTHYHSYCENYEEIKEIAKNKKIKIIEDCAIAFGTKVNNIFIGNDSDISVFSFNMTKFISTLSGGLLVCSDDKLFLKIKNYSKEFKNNPFAYLIKKYLKAVQIKIFTSTIIFNLFTRWFIKFAIKSNLRIFNNLVRTDPDPKFINKLSGHYNSFVTNYQRKDIFIKINNYFEKDYQKKRLENYIYYQENLSLLSDITIHKIKLNEKNGVVSFPFFYKRRDKMYNFLISNGCDVSKYYYRNCSSLKIFEQFNNICKNADKACDEVILLPIYPKYSKTSIDKNIQTIKNYFKEQN